jgi:hypothetical protein
MNSFYFLFVVFALCFIVDWAVGEQQCLDGRYCTDDYYCCPVCYLIHTYYIFISDLFYICINFDRVVVVENGSAAIIDTLSNMTYLDLLDVIKTTLIVNSHSAK